MKIVLTRPLGRNEKLARRLEKIGHKVIVTPLLVIEPCIHILPKLPENYTVIFTSPAAVDNFHYWDNICGKKVLAVGKTTATKLENKGITVAFYPQTQAGLKPLMEYGSYSKIDYALIVTQKGGRLPLNIKTSSCECYTTTKVKLKNNHDYMNAAIVLTSAKAANNLFTSKPINIGQVITSSDEIIELARGFGVDKYIKVVSANDDDIISAIAANVAP